jgi:hypothetical protein
MLTLYQNKLEAGKSPVSPLVKVNQKKRNKKDPASAGFFV